MRAGSLMKIEALTQLRQHLDLPDLQVVLKPEWSSDTADHRLKIRKGLLEEIEKLMRLNDEQREDILDLQKVPVLPQVGFSISHNKKCGGFALNPQGQAVGLDVEISQRVQDRLIARVAANKEEVGLTPSAASLWTAKEAAIKSLYRSGRQPSVIAEVEIGDWQKRNGLETCRFITNDPTLSQNRGCVMELEDMKLAVFTV